MRRASGHEGGTCDVQCGMEWEMRRAIAGWEHADIGARVETAAEWSDRLTFRHRFVWNLALCQSVDTVRIVFLVPMSLSGDARQSESKHLD